MRQIIEESPNPMPKDGLHFGEIDLNAGTNVSSYFVCELVFGYEKIEHS